MVEMLGVLAVIGVLSVAGIAGYNTAMRSHKANEVLNAASMFYVLAKAQNQGNGPSGNINYADVGGTNPSGATLTYTDNAFTITFTDTDDCTMAANKLGDKATTDCTNKKLTVNFGETTTSQTPEEPQEDLTIVDMQDGNCPSGYKPTGIDDKCAKSLTDAAKLCSSGCAQDTPLEYACVDSSYCL